MSSRNEVLYYNKIKRAKTATMVLILTNIVLSEKKINIDYILLYLHKNTQN